ncbi:deoxyribose-phosphate aldolase [Cladorrhinum samala]|uniref:deoxyribose-phosphate aldolase n=1 Tax=Cladorrhinum samala TaxID=585594 RepID=A0AAV9HGK6_9PEZI|nr:deoxyribose-phosphate aldolase [Cladorrhinum samala]
MATPKTISVSVPQLAKLIDHSLLQPNLTDAEIHTGLEIAKKYSVAAACVKPYSIQAAKQVLAGSPVLICAVIGFPHGNSVTEIKVAEAVHAVKSGAHEIDMVVNVGKVLSGDWDYVSAEIRAINDAVLAAGAAPRGSPPRPGGLKVIFENDYLEDVHIIRLCKICTEVGVAFVKTSTGYGFVKQPSGDYNYKGATVPRVKLMREHCGPEVQIKAAGGVRTLDDFLYMMHLGVTRIGATATVAILEGARARGIGDEPVEVELKTPSDNQVKSGGY